jgi:hypothetical protein
MKLTNAQRRVLQAMSDDVDVDLAWAKGGGWWIGDEQTNGGLALFLIRRMLVSAEESGGGMERYRINESGERALRGEKPYRDADGNYYDDVNELFAAKGEQA